MIQENDEERLVNAWHYLAIKSIPNLFRGIASNHHGDSCCRRCCHSYSSKKALQKHEQLCKNHKPLKPNMSHKSNNIVKFTAIHKGLKAPHIMYYDLEALLIKYQYVNRNTDQTYTEKKNKHVACGYAINTVKIYDQNKTIHNRGKDCMKEFVKDIRHEATEMINVEQKPMIPLTKEQKQYHCSQQKCFLCLKPFVYEKDNEDYMKLRKVRDHDHYTGQYRGAAHSECNLKYSVIKEIAVIAHNASSYDVHFIIRDLAEEFNGHINVIAENIDKYISFKVPIKKQIEEKKFATFKLKYIDSMRFMKASLSKLVYNLSEN